MFDLRLMDNATRKEMDAQLLRLQNLLAMASKLVNVYLLIAVEGAIVTADRTHFVKSIEGIDERDLTSAQKSIRGVQEASYGQMDEMNGMLALRIVDAATFHHYAVGTREAREFDNEGLPKDGIRRLMASHATRLRNKEANAERGSEIEQNVIGFRRTNLARAERLYKGLQREGQPQAKQSQHKD